MRKLICALLLSLTAAAFAAEPSQFTVGGFSFARPDGWGWVNPTSPMRKAQLSVTGEKGNGEVTFFHFGAGMGGSVDSNVQRWCGQFGGPEVAKAKTAIETYGTVKVTYVSANGTFNSGMPGGPTTPMENYALLGAILQDATNGDVYVKLTGPAATVEAATPAFQKMIKTATAK
ncbi:MAG: hypothetical protein ABIP97_00100 [Chthoniobacterales bacterium]